MALAKISRTQFSSDFFGGLTKDGGVVEVAHAGEGVGAGKDERGVPPVRPPHCRVRVEKFLGLAAAVRIQPQPRVHVPLHAAHLVLKIGEGHDKAQAGGAGFKEDEVHPAQRVLIELAERGLDRVGHGDVAGPGPVGEGEEAHEVRAPRGGRPHDRPDVRVGDVVEHQVKSVSARKGHLGGVGRGPRAEGRPARPHKVGGGRGGAGEGVGVDGGAVAA